MTENEFQKSPDVIFNGHCQDVRDVISEVYCEWQNGKNNCNFIREFESLLSAVFLLRL